MLYKKIISPATQDFKLLSFITALSLYALWGSPTPDAPGFVEALIGLLLFLSVGGVAGLFNIFQLYKEKQVPFLLFGGLLFLYGLFVPSIKALINNHDIIVTVRDLIGFMFLCLPVLFVQFFERQNDRQKFFLYMLIVLSALFSVRVLYGEVHLIGTQTVELLYLVNSPIVMFTLFFLPFWSVRKVYMQCTPRHIIQMIALLGVTALILFATLQDVQRAPVFGLIASIGLFFVVSFSYAPRRFAYILPLLIIPVFFMWPYLQSVLDDLLQKTVRVGVNMRFQELIAICDAMRGDPLTVLFGAGWGGSYASPAVGNLYVTYSHSLLSYVFFKMGVLGLAMTGIYLFFVLKGVFEIARRDLVLGNALFWALIIPIFLYASHKSFDFGLLLILIFVSYQKIQKDSPKDTKRQTDKTII